MITDQAERGKFSISRDLHSHLHRVVGFTFHHEKSGWRPGSFVYGDLCTVLVAGVPPERSIVPPRVLYSGSQFATAHTQVYTTLSHRQESEGEGPGLSKHLSWFLIPIILSGPRGYDWVIAAGHTQAQKF